MSKIIDRIIRLIISVAILVLIWIFIVSVTQIKGDSMTPTLKDGDVMVVNKVIYYLSDVRRFDTVLIEENSNKYIRRVMALPGDTVKYVDNKLIVDGKQYIGEAELDLNDFSINDLGYEKVPDGYYLVVSDNKNTIEKSVSLVPREEIKARLTLRVWPFDKFGFIK